MKAILNLAAAFFLFIGLYSNAQSLVWADSALNNDFFDEGNWKNSITNSVPQVEQ
jgi:hypothetical protein